MLAAGACSGAARRACPDERAAAGTAGQGPGPAADACRAAYAPFLSRTVRAVVRGGHVYLVPRENGELVVGATSEELGWDTTVTAGGVYELLRDAHELVPGITELPLTETRAGLRPGSPDNAPLLGPTALPGLHAGHRPLPQRRAAHPGHRRRDGRACWPPANCPTRPARSPRGGSRVRRLRAQEQPA